MNKEIISNILCDQVINIALLYDEAINTKVTISIKNVDNVSRFNTRIKGILKYVSNLYLEYRIKAILKYVSNLYFEYEAGIIDYNYVINKMHYLYNLINCTYKYNEGTFCFKTINSMKDVINETIENLTNK